MKVNIGPSRRPMALAQSLLRKRMNPGRSPKTRSTFEMRDNERRWGMRTLLEKKTEPLLRNNPFGFLRRMTEEMDRAFGLDPRFGTTTIPETATWAPAIEVFERNNTFFVRAELPGLTKEDVKVTVLNDELTIEGERTREADEKKEGFYRTERAYGGFYRRIVLPEHVETAGAKATFKNGVLQIELPTIPLPEATKRTLEIQG
jgi:HSP20 family protein